MADAWVVLELNSRSEQEDPDIVRSAILKTLKGSEIFIPAVVTQVGEDRVIHYLMEGYAFVRFDRPSNDYFKLENSKYVQTVLVNPGTGSRYKRISTVADKEIFKMRDQIRHLTEQGIGVGDVVRITSGPYRNILATVVEELPEQRMVQVHVSLRSKQSIVTLPRSFLVVTSRAPLSSVSNRLNDLKNWADLAHPIFTWSETTNRLVETYKSYEKLELWRRQASELYTLRHFDQLLYETLKRLKAKTNGINKLCSWQNQGKLLYPFVGFYHGFLTAEQLSKIHGKIIDLIWVEDMLNRIRNLSSEVEEISRTFAQHQEGTTLTHNVIVDGHNLAFRCLYAPGMSNLMDSSGRPTGVILGFLKSLGALKKRYPDAVIYVVWDGSSKRRKARFGEYKANRSRSEFNSTTSEIPSGVRFDPILVLKGLLPSLGIRQAWNPEEEADDVIATLVRTTLQKQNNVIFTTDKDMLQLVSETTTVLIPAIGSRNEILFDSDTVLRLVGVPPGKMVELRSLYGDPSDNIPGVPRVPKKVLKSLIQVNGSIEAVYRSGLKGLTKGQYERLRSAEPQVRINIELMTLVDVKVDIQQSDVDPDIAVSILGELEINPDSITQTFFGDGQQP